MPFTPAFSRRAVLHLLWLICLLPATSGAASPSSTPAAAQSSPEPPIQYTVRFPAPNTHYAEVEALIPAAPGPDAEVFMAVWTPGSYLVREYARHVEEFRAFSTDGRALPVSKSRKNRWRITTGQTQPSTVRLQYRVYCRALSVQESFIEQDFAVLNGASLFVTLPERIHAPHEVTFVLPPNWSRSMTGLDPIAGAAHRYRAADFDTLLDSPALLGNPAVYEFEVGGKKHYLVNEGEGGVWDGARSVRDVQKIVEEFYRMWGHLPYERYYFLNVLAERGGGLEHKNSTLMMTTRWATRTPERYLGWLGLVSHEYFHTWNVKRLRPAELGPFDYENENYTRSLWMAEGFTSYYGPLALRRAGLSTPADVLRAYSNSIQALQSTPGRAVQPAELASYDAWIRLYRPDENSRNVSISYYTKGAVIGLLLDAKIRNLSSGARSLDDVMRLAYERYSGPRGFTPEEFRAVVIDVAGAQHAPSLHDWLTRALETGEELDYSEFLDYYGLHFKPESDANSESSATTPPAPKPGWTGLVTSTVSGRLNVSQVLRGTPGYDAGFNSGDEILAIGDFRVTPESWNQRLAAYRPGDTVSVLVSRRDRLIRLETKLGQEPSRRYELQIRPDATTEQRHRQQAWWGAGPPS